MMMRRTMMSNGVSKFNSDFGLSIFVFECASVLATLGPLFGPVFAHTSAIEPHSY